MDSVFETKTVTSSSAINICNPWREPLRCPLIFYTILVILGIILNLSAVSRMPNVDRNGKVITSSRKWTGVLIGLIIYVVIAYLFGHWMYNLCKKCETLNSWLVFLLAIFFPIILLFVVGLIIAAIVGVGMFWTW